MISAGERRIDRHSVVTLHRLAILREDDSEVFVGRPDANRYISVPGIGADIIERLSLGRTVAEIERELAADGGEEIDVLGFVEELRRSYDFVHRIDGVTVSEPEAPRDRFAWIPAKVGAALFGPKMYIAAGGLLLLSIGWIARDPSALPTVADFFAVSSPAVNVALAAAFAWSLLFLHELAHVAAARPFGVPCRIGIGHRFVFPVAETDMTGIVMAPRRERYRAYLAGMLIDSLLFTAGVGVAALQTVGVLMLEAQASALVRMVHFHALHMLLFQCLFFLKTDLYYVITTYARCGELLEHTYVFLRRLLRLARPADDEAWAAVPARERKLIYGYAAFVVVGLALTLYWFFSYYLPLTYRLCALAFDRLAAYPVGFWPGVEALLLLAVQGLPFGLLLNSWAAELLRRRREGGERDEENQGETG